MSSAHPGGRPPGWRPVNATLSGILAGVGALVLDRTLFGPGLLLRVGLVGLAATAGVVGSLLLTSPGRRPEGDVRPKRVRPLHWFAPVVGGVVAVLAWGAVAHSSGSGWVQAVGALLAAGLAVGLLAPAIPARRASVHCTGSPADGQAGRTATVTLVASGPVRITPLSPPGAPTRAVGSARRKRPVEVTMTPPRRGVFTAVVVEVASCAPFGLLWWSKRIDVALPRAWQVAPRLGPPGMVATGADPTPGLTLTRLPARVGEPRGVRPYQPGDVRGSVHWPATAHTGSLMVREMERPTDDPVVVDLVLPGDPAEAEAVAERAMTALSAHLAEGRRVLLGTTEPAGPRRQPVRDRIELGRRLARAVPPPGPPPRRGSGGRRGSEGPAGADQPRTAIR